MDIATGYLIGRASRGEGISLDLSGLTYKQFISIFILPMSFFILVLLGAFDNSVHIEDNVDNFGIKYSKNIVVDGGYMFPVLDIDIKEKTAHTGRLYKKVRLRTNDGKIIKYSGKIVGQDYENLIKYLSEGCIINNRNWNFEVSGIYFRYTLWKYKTFK